MRNDQIPVQGTLRAKRLECLLTHTARRRRGKNSPPALPTIHQLGGSDALPVGGGASKFSETPPVSPC